MLYNESLWIKKNLSKLPLSPGARILNLGSSTLRFRTIDQPYISENVFLPLLKRGCSIINADKKKEDGVDRIIDIEHSSSKEQFDLVLCTNLLEHVYNIKDAARRVTDWVRPGGYLLITVPHLFPHHEDPIDNGFRPSRKDLEKLFLHKRVLKSAIIRDRFPNEFFCKYKVSVLLLQVLA
ncbi:MAG: methyltransferase domain-containing protein [Candidatus Woesearchaeota archaeon]